MDWYPWLCMVLTAASVATIGLFTYIMLMTLPG